MFARLVYLKQPSLSEVILSTAPNHVFLYLALRQLPCMQCESGTGTRLGSCVLEVRKESLLYPNRCGLFGCGWTVSVHCCKL